MGCSRLEFCPLGGLAPQIRELASQPHAVSPPSFTAWPTDEVRSRIIPINRKYPLKVLLEACDYYVAKKRRMTFQYILIVGVNDTDEQARELAKIARHLSAKIKLIPYDTVEGGVAVAYDRIPTRSAHFVTERRSNSRT